MINDNNVKVYLNDVELKGCTSFDFSPEPIEPLEIEGWLNLDYSVTCTMIIHKSPALWMLFGNRPPRGMRAYT